MILKLETNFVTEMKLKLVIDRVNEIEQNGVKVYVHCCFLQWHSVKNCRALYKSVLYFIEYSAPFFTLKMMLKYSLHTVHGR
jgi:hypothetical protein